MNQIDLLFFFTVTLCFVSSLSLIMVLRRDLMMLQQNSYRKDRYVKWINSSGETTTFRRIFTIISLFLLLAFPRLTLIIYPIVSIICIWNFLDLLFAKYKKPLAMTSRAKRLFITSLAIVSVIIVVGYIFAEEICILPILLLALAILSPFVTILSLIILSPVESAINRKYYNEASAILKSMPELKIIGITGSYGKTSTKHYLYRILSEQYDVMMTPGSYNTTLGVIRTVREYLKPYNEVFIVEMGAKQIGDIKEICDLVHPGIGIVTAVGEQHLESFKTIENVQKTKFELIDSLPKNGFAVVNNDFKYVRNREVVNVESVRYSVSDKAPKGYRADNIIYNPYGTEFDLITPNGETIHFSTPLLGECNISNLLGAIAVALYLNEPIEKICYAVSHIEQVEHRLSRKITPGGITIIDDAFNSNPDGSRMALDVLKQMKTGKRIVVTPGMIELGEKQYELNKAFGSHIAESADIAIIVGKYNREAIVEGIMTKAFDENNLFTVDSFAQAQALLTPMLTKGDIVLYENDLPDTYK